MAGAFAAYMALKGLSRIWAAPPVVVVLGAVAVGLMAYLAAKPYLANATRHMKGRKEEIYQLFNVPLIIGVCLLSFAHGANDVANAVGPLAAIVSTLSQDASITSQVAVPFWVMSVGAFGIAVGLCLFGPKLIKVVGEKITRLNAPRAYCVALSSAITVLLATTLGLPVSSTHIAVGAVFGVGFVREYVENPNRRKRRPGHKLNATAEEAFNSPSERGSRRLVRRKFVVLITAAWLVTVPGSALLAATVYALLQLL